MVEIRTVVLQRNHPPGHIKVTVAVRRGAPEIVPLGVPVRGVRNLNLKIKAILRELGIKLGYRKILVELKNAKYGSPNLFIEFNQIVHAILFGFLINKNKITPPATKKKTIIYAIGDIDLENLKVKLDTNLAPLYMFTTRLFLDKPIYVVNLLSTYPHKIKYERIIPLRTVRYKTLYITHAETIDLVPSCPGHLTTSWKLLKYLFNTNGYNLSYIQLLPNALLKHLCLKIDNLQNLNTNQLSKLLYTLQSGINWQIISWPCRCGYWLHPEVPCSCQPRTRQRIVNTLYAICKQSPKVHLLFKQRKIKLESCATLRRILTL